MLRFTAATLAIGATLVFTAPSRAVDNGDTNFGRPGNAAAVTRTIKVEGYEFEFSPSALDVKLGETVKFVFANTGTQAHELTIGDAAFQTQHRQMMAKPGHNHAEGHEHGMHGATGNVVSAKPGETRELIWQFTKAGRFELDCNLPGHADLGMTAVIEVR